MTLAIDRGWDPNPADHRDKRMPHSSFTVDTGDRREMQCFERSILNNFMPDRQRIPAHPSQAPFSNDSPELSGRSPIERGSRLRRQQFDHAQRPSRLGTRHPDSPIRDVDDSVAVWMPDHQAPLRLKRNAWQRYEAVWVRVALQREISATRRPLWHFGSPTRICRRPAGSIAASTRS